MSYCFPTAKRLAAARVRVKSLADDADSARFLPPVPFCGGRSVFALVLVRGRRLRDHQPGDVLFLTDLECVGVSHPVSDCDAARVWPCLGLPASGRAGESDRALAA